MEKWNAVLLKINERYIQGKEPHAPYECYETKGEIPKLILGLQNFGVFTYSIQLYQQSITRCAEGGYYAAWQKPYVSFIVVDEPSKFLERLYRERELAIYAVLVRPYEVLHDYGTSAVTQHCWAGSVQALHDAEWEIDITLSAKDPSDGDYEDLFSLAFFRQNRAWAIDVASIKWGVDINLFKIIERASTNLKGRQIWDEIPPEIFANIAQHLEPREIQDFRLSSRRSRELAEITFQEYFRTIIVNATPEGARKLQDFFGENISQYTRRVVIRENWVYAEKAIRAIRTTLNGIDREIAVVFQCRDTCGSNLQCLKAPFFDYKWPIELEGVGADNLGNATPGWYDFLSSVQSIELIIYPRGLLGGYIIDAKEALLSFISRNKEKKILSIVHYSQLPDEDNNLLEDIVKVGIKVTKVHFNQDLVWKRETTPDKCWKINLTNFIQENQGIGSTETAKERRLGIVLGKWIGFGSSLKP